MEKAREFQKNICFIDYDKAFDCVDHNKLWKILKEMGLPDHLTYPREICMQFKKQQLELDTEQQTGSKLGNEYVKAVYCLFNLYAKYVMRNTGLDKAQAGTRMPGKISITSDMQMAPPLWQKVKKSKRTSWW